MTDEKKKVEAGKIIEQCYDARSQEYVVLVRLQSTERVVRCTECDAFWGTNLCGAWVTVLMLDAAVAPMLGKIQSLVDSNLDDVWRHGDAEAKKLWQAPPRNHKRSAEEIDDDHRSALELLDLSVKADNKRRKIEFATRARQLQARADAIERHAKAMLELTKEMKLTVAAPTAQTEFSATIVKLATLKRDERETGAKIYALDRALRQELHEIVGGAVDPTST